MVGQSGNGRKRPIVIETRTQVDPANAERRSQNLPWRSPVSSPMPSSCGSRAWTHGRSRRQRRDEETGEVSRGHSSSLVRRWRQPIRATHVGEAHHASQERRRAESLLPRSQSETTRWIRSDSKANSTDPYPRGGRRGAPRRDRRRRNRSGSVRGVASIHGVRPSTSLDHGLDLGPDHGRDRNRVLDGKDLRWHEFAPSPSTGKGEQGGARALDGMTVDETRTLARRASTGTDGVASGRDVRAESGARGADPQAGRAKRRDAAIGHPDGRRPTGAAVDPAGAGTFAGPHLFEPSYGFRPRRGTHDALRKAKEYVAEGRSVVVDVDLEKFFDRVNHDILMSRLARRIADKRLLRIVRRFLQAGMMKDGV